MAKTHANLLADFRRAIRNSSATAADFDYYMNLTIPTFLRRLSGAGLHRSHYRYIPKLILTLTQDTWQYDWLTVAKYSNATLDITSGVTEAITGVKSTYFISPGDICTYDSTDRQILSVASTTFTINSSVTDTNKTAYVYARPLYFTDAFVLPSSGTAGTSEYLVRRWSDMQVPTGNDWGRFLKFRQVGDKIEISWNPTTSDKLHLYYIPEPIVFDNTNPLMTALANPTQLTDEANQAAVWNAAKAYFVQKGAMDDAKNCSSVMDEIMGVAGLSKGMTEW